MKTLFLLIALCLFITGKSSQSISLGHYCVSEVNGKTVVMLDNNIIGTSIQIDSTIQLLPDGIVIWEDQTTTILREGDCIDDSGIVFSTRAETDFIGNPNALNHIHMLPEATVTGEAKANKSEISDYITYMEKLYKEIEKNDYAITQIKQKLWTLTRKETTKYRKKLNSIERENMELKIEYDTFIHFGLLGDFPSFRAEMINDLKPIAQDLTLMKAELF